MASPEIEVRIYNHSLKDVWDEFVDFSKNGTFLLKRDYMDYHSDRFQDLSLLVYRKGKLYCLLPGCVKEKVYYSHAGLTYGGLIMGLKCSATGILDVFAVIRKELRNYGIERLIYKPSPHIYHKYPSEEDLYALFRNDAQLKVRNISSTVPLASKLNFIKDRRAALRKAMNAGIIVEETADYQSFWNILEENLGDKYGVKPVHSLREMEGLVEKFPDNIRLFGAFKDGRMIGGVVCYITSMAVHAQYISADREGKSLGAIDAIVNFLLNERFNNKTYFDFGTSNENGGLFLNENLIYQKEGFGGRGVCYDTYEINL